MTCIAHDTSDFVFFFYFTLAYLKVEVWKEVNRQFVDSSFNGLGKEGWEKKKLDAVKKLSAPEVR